MIKGRWGPSTDFISMNSLRVSKTLWIRSSLSRSRALRTRGIRLLYFFRV